MICKLLHQPDLTFRRENEAYIEIKRGAIVQSTMYLYAAAIAAYICTMAASIPFGWSSPAIPLLKREDSPVLITDDEGSWIASTFLLGSAAGPLMSLVVAHVIGRKTLLLLTAVPWIVGGIMIVVATSAWELMFSRFITGLGTGVCFSVVPMYLGEISPPQIRGILLTIVMTASRLGILFAYVLIPFVSIHTSTLITLSVPIIFFLYFAWLPESPYYWMRRGRRERAAKSLILLRGTKDIQVELELIESSVRAEMARSGGVRELFCVPGNRKSLTVGVVLGLTQQLSGSQAIMMYTQTIFDQANVDLEGKYLAIILGIVQVICTLLCAVVVDRHGRRPLLLFSSIGSTFATFVIATYFNLQYTKIDTASIEWLPATGCMVYVVFYSLGLAPLPTTMLGELFPTNIKPQACAMVVFIVNFTGFVVGKTYQLVSDSVGTHVAFWIFTGFNVLCVVYVYFCVPETKGKTLQQIQYELHHKKGEINKIAR